MQVSDDLSTQGIAPHLIVFTPLCHSGRRKKKKKVCSIAITMQPSTSLEMPRHGNTEG